MWIAKVAVSQKCAGNGFNIADINFDCLVDLLDYAIFAQRWLQ